jgi:4a-hydroxytetrahydrobiopterin dehydratase
VATGRTARRQSVHPGWRRAGDSLVRELAFRDFEAAMAFVDRIAAAVEDHLRRPDMCIVDFNRVRITITNPHHAGITQAELRLAEKVNGVVSR